MKKNGAGASSTPAPSSFLIYPPVDLEGIPPASAFSRFTSLRPRVLDPEDGQHAALVAEVARVAERAERAQTGRRIFSADAGGYADTGPAADTGEYGHVLLAIRTVVGHRVADDARRGLELPERLAGLRHRRALSQPSMVP